MQVALVWLLHPAWDSLRLIITRPRLILEAASSIGAGLCALKSKAAPGKPQPTAAATQRLFAEWKMSE